MFVWKVVGIRERGDGRICLLWRQGGQRGGCHDIGGMDNKGPGIKAAAGSEEETGLGDTGVE